MNFRYREDGTINVALDETTTPADVGAIVKVFATGTDAFAEFDRIDRRAGRRLSAAHSRTDSEFLTHPVFNTHHSETEMMRYIRGWSARTSAWTRR